MDANQTLEQVDAMLAELGLDGELQPSYPPPPQRNNNGQMSSGPGGRGMSNGPGSRIVSAGPGRGGMSNGPGGMMLLSNGPGAMARGAVPPPKPLGRAMATHTPDGRALNFSGPPCAGCGEMIIGPVINALDQTWHPEHFLCCHCGKAFKGGNFVEQDGKAYCDDDYNDLFGPKCATCLKPVTDKCINALGKVYHPDHFICAGCGTELRGKPYKEDEGEPYCLICKASRSIKIDPVAGVCSKCKKQIIGEYITLNGMRMHPEHYRCEECGCEFRGGNCHEYEGKLYCYTCYLKLLKNICHFCQKPIVGRSLTALGRLWHPDHFMCTECKTPFAGSNFFEHGSKPYCEMHYVQLFGKVCHKCNKPIANNGIAAFGYHYHDEHFTCFGCDKPLGKEICDFEGKAFCKSCYGKIPRDTRKKLEKKKEGELKAQKQREKEAQKMERGE